MARVTLNRVYITVELDTGEILEDLRVTVQDQARYTRSAKANRWDRDDAVRQNGYLAWSSANRQGLTDLNYEDWEQALVDLDFLSIPASEDQETNEQDPTEASMS